MDLFAAAESAPTPAAGTCAACKNSAQTYNLRCPACCARLVASGRPSKRAQETLLAVIERMHGPSRAQILALLKES